MFGLDYVAAPSIAAMKAAGVTFVCRYLSAVNDLTKIKLLTLEEAKALSEGGIAIVSNYEWYANRPLEGFASGVSDARIAQDQHAACGGPANRPIYFSVDFDATGQDVAMYFRGVASVLGRDRVGAYGSERVLKYLFDQGLITWGWQTYAWSGGAWEPRAHIQQYQNGVTLAAHSVDYDRSMKPDFGQWIQGGSSMGIPTGWHDDGVTLTAPNGHFLQHGFRNAVVDAAIWDPGDQPNEEEYGTPQVLLHNISVGGGTRITTRDHLLWWTEKAGVHVEPYPGLELKAAYDLIAQQQAEIATLKTQPSPTPPIDTTALKASINAIADGVAKDVALALVEVGKL